MAGAGFKTFTAGSILTASDVNTYLMQQSTMVFASTTARDAAITSPSEGMVAYTSDTDTYWYYNGTAWATLLNAGAWTSFTPSWTNLTVGNATNTGAYAVVGKTCFFRCKITLGSTSSVGSNPTLTLPVTGKVGDESGLFNINLNGAYFAQGYMSSTTVLQMRLLNSAGTYATWALVTSTAPVTWAATNYIVVSGAYEIA